MTISKLTPYLSSLDGLMTTSQAEKGAYVHPTFRNLGSVSIVLVREIVAPTIFRNSEQEITDIQVPTSDGPIPAIRAVPNKFKHRERARGLQILRHFGVGGRFPQNRSSVRKDAPLAEVFDLNSFVFGDSANRDGKVLPVKAAALYGDGLSTTEYVGSVGKTTHNRASEDGSLFDPAKKANSTALFERHFVLPGTLLIQTISTIGRVMPPEALDHLLLTIGGGGVYGGQTSITGVNIRTHVAGIYAGKVERPEASPYLLAADILAGGGSRSIGDVMASIEARLAPLHSVSIGREEAGDYLRSLGSRLEADDADLRRQYGAAAEKVGELFTEWFGGKAV